MIDIESQVYSYIYKKLAFTEQGGKGDITVSSMQQPTVSTMPHVSIAEVSNTTLTNTLDSLGYENHARVLYEINVYTNRKDGKKAECKSIMADVDRLFQNLGFTRVMMMPITNMLDSGIYRMVARYEAIVSKDNKIFRR